MAEDLDRGLVDVELELWKAARSAAGPCVPRPDTSMQFFMDLISSSGAETGG